MWPVRDACVGRRVGLHNVRIDRKALDGSSRRKALGAPENAAVPLATASRSGRALRVRLRRTHLEMPINQLRSDRRSASLIPSGSSRFSASTSARLERFAPRAAIQREVRPCRGMTETSSSRLARLADGFFGAHDGAGRRAVNPVRDGARTCEPTREPANPRTANQNPSTRATREPL